jgi:magnesium transporter
MVNTLLLPELRELLAEGNKEALAEVLNDFHPASVADFAEGLSVEETWQLLDCAPLPRQGAVFAFFPPYKQVELLKAVSRERVTHLLEAMSHDDRVRLLKELDEHMVESLLPLVARADREDIRKLLAYPESSAGALMTTDYASLPADVTVTEAIKLLRQQAPAAETIYYIYVLDHDRRLLGFVSLRDVILASPGALVHDIMQHEVISVRVDEDQAKVAKLMAKYDFLAMPVVDEQHRLVGIITHDDVIDVVVEEATEDVQKMGGVTPIEGDYLHAPFVTVWRKRAGWLACLFVAELFTFTAMSYFEDSIAQLVVLSLFVPLCISTGGNSGSQAATLITRALALGQVTLPQWWKVLRHELTMGIVLGLSLGLIGFLRGAATPEDTRRNPKKAEESFVIVLPENHSQPKQLSPDTWQVPGNTKQIVESELDSGTQITIPHGHTPEPVDGKPGTFRFPKDTVLRTEAVSFWRLGMVIAMSVAIICLWGTMVGAMLPLVFKRLGFDPGYASSPFVATFVDVTGIVIYFSIAKIWLLN